MPRDESDNRPAKRIRLEETADSPVGGEETRKEVRVGITAFVNSDLLGFTGVLKKRYTDFLVNEVLPNGQVLHLEDVAAGTSSLDGSKSGQAEKLVDKKLDIENAAAEQQAAEAGKEVAETTEDVSASIKV
jgi:tRNA pseudouridine13 synthase